MLQTKIQNQSPCKMVHHFQDKQNQKSTKKLSVVMIVIFITVLFGLAWVLFLEFGDADGKNKLGSLMEGMDEGKRRRLGMVSFQSGQIYESRVTKNVYNPQNTGKQFCKQQRFATQIDVQSLKRSPELYAQLDQVEIINSIQVGSYYDYTNLTHTVNFQKLKQDIEQSIAYQQIKFLYDENLENKKKPGILELKEFANSTTEQEDDQVYYRLIAARRGDEDFQIRIGAGLTRVPDMRQMREVQYRHYNSKYNISQQTQELPICIYGSGYKLFQKNRYKQFFLSLERQNYTNFHIAYIDDNSPQQQINGIINYLSKSELRIKNRLTMIRTLQHLGAQANMYFWINKLCKENQIVVNVDADDALIGTQAMRVISKVYEDPSSWFVYSRYILTKKGHMDLSDGFSGKMVVSALDYRNQFSQWDISHLRTFRKKLFSKIPLQMMIEYHLDNKTNLAYPSFYSFAFDTFQIFNMLEMTGDEHYKFITDYLYLYFGAGSTVSTQSCYSKHEKYDDFKCRIKTPLRKLQSLDDGGRFVQQLADYRPPQRTWDAFKYIHLKYKMCLKGVDDPE